MSSRTYPALSHVKRRIVEALAWCASDYALSNRFRTPQLQPKSPLIVEEQLPDGTRSHRYLKTEDQIALVDDVAKRRAELLELHKIEVGNQVPVSPRMLLVTEIEHSFWDGLSEMESKGFFDVYDIPAWDTWIDMRKAANTHELLCCVPASLGNDAQAGMDVTCANCIVWVDHLITLKP